MSQGENQITVAVLPGVTESTVHWFQIDSHAARSVLSGFDFHEHFPFLFSDISVDFISFTVRSIFLGEKEKPKAEKRKSPPFFFRVVIRGRLIFPRLACRDRNATSLDGWRAAKKLLYTFHSSLGFSMAINEEGERCCCENRKKKYPAFFLLPGGLIDPSQHKHTHTQMDIHFSDYRNPWRQHDN